MSKVTLTFNSPDAFYYACKRIHPDEHDRATTVVLETLGSIMNVTIEVDLITGEAKIIKRK